jgi:hypothetical protein
LEAIPAAFLSNRLVHRAGTLITEVVVAKGKSLRINEVAPTLLRLVNRLDSLKVGIDEDDDVFIRNEAQLKSLHPEEFAANIESVVSRSIGPIQ